MEYKFEIDNTKKRILDFLIKYDKHFTPPLSGRVNLNKYAEKMSLYGCNIFVYSDKDIAHACLYSNSKTDKNAFLSSICIDESYKGTSLAAEILKKIEFISIQQGSLNLKLEVDCSNTRAISFYSKHEFEIIKKNNKTIIMYKKLH